MKMKNEKFESKHSRQLGSPNSMDREMDPEICSWIIEFFVRNSTDEMLLKKLINDLPPPPLYRKPRMMKTVLLHTIKTEINAGNISEKILDHLEKIERIDCSQRLRIQDSMKDAYCAVALECTPKYLPGRWDGNDKYLDVVNTIWRERIENLEKSKASKLVSELLRRLEAAVGDEEVADSLIRTNMRNNAIVAVRLYLRETLDLMGPPLLEKMVYGMATSSSSSSSSSSTTHPHRVS